MGRETVVPVRLTSRERWRMMPGDVSGSRLVVFGPRAAARRFTMARRWPRCSHRRREKFVWQTRLLPDRPRPGRRGRRSRGDEAADHPYWSARAVSYTAPRAAGSPGRADLTAKAFGTAHVDSLGMSCFIISTHGRFRCHLAHNELEKGDLREPILP